jgi:hypothetical protein
MMSSSIAASHGSSAQTTGAARHHGREAGQGLQQVRPGRSPPSAMWSSMQTDLRSTGPDAGGDRPSAAPGRLKAGRIDAARSRASYGVPDRSADRCLTMRGMGALISQTSTPRRMAGYLRLREAASERPGHRVVFLTSSRHIAHVWDRNRTGGCISSMTPPSIVGVADFAASATEPTVRV